MFKIPQIMKNILLKKLYLTHLNKIKSISFYMKKKKT